MRPDASGYQPPEHPNILLFLQEIFSVVLLKRVEVSGLPCPLIRGVIREAGL